MSTKRRKTAYPDQPRQVLLFSTSVRHPLNVKPGGNQFLCTTSTDLLSKAAQMGYLAHFPDELVMLLLSYIQDPTTLLNLSHTSRVMYAFVYDEELWKKIFMTREDNELVWRGSWRSTVLNITEPAMLQLPDNLLCSDVLYRPFQCSQINYPKLFHKIISEEETYHKDALENKLAELPRGRIPRVQETEMTSTRFASESHDSPFILVNSDESRWPNWDLTGLLNRFPNVKFRQEAVKWPLRKYAEYLQSNADENPLYLFDCNSDAMKSLKQEYEPPAIFQEDYFKMFTIDGTTCRPDNAWLIVGSLRLGSTFHKDPNYTSAWNAALTGRKLWVMLPPTVTPPGVGTNDDESEVTSPVGIGEWVLSGFYNDAVKMPECLVGITFPGECMYVPAGWWHSVINLDDSVALTQNFVPRPKLAQALNFFKNKQAQVSGFRPNAVKEMIDVVTSKLDQDDAEVKKLRNYCDELALDTRLGDEDCGEILQLPPMPIYELFTQLMRVQGKGPELDVALVELEKIERKDYELQNGRSKKWEQLTLGTFLFGFDVDCE